MICPWDGTEFIPRSVVHRFCSSDCRNRTMRAIKKYGDKWEHLARETDCKGCGRRIWKHRLDIQYCCARCSARSRKMIQEHGQTTPPIVRSNCEQCNKRFQKSKKSTKYCSKRCRKKAQYIRFIAGKEASNPHCSECQSLCKVKPSGGYPFTCSKECGKNRTIRIATEWTKKNRARIRANDNQSCVVRAYIAKTSLSPVERAAILHRLFLARKAVTRIGVNKRTKKFWLDTAELIQGSTRGIVSVSTFVSVFNHIDCYSTIISKFSRWKKRILSSGLGSLQDQADIDEQETVTPVVLDIQLCIDSSNTALGIPMI